MRKTEKKQQLIRHIIANRKALERSEKRISEPKRLFIEIYEDNASGKRRQHIHIQRWTGIHPAE